MARDSKINLENIVTNTVFVKNSSSGCCSFSATSEHAFHLLGIFVYVTGRNTFVKQEISYHCHSRAENA